MQTAFLIKEFLFKITSLREFICRGNKIGDEGMSVISEALHAKNSSLNKLDITKTGITAVSFKSILTNIRYSHHQHLRTLIVDHNDLSTNAQFEDISYMISSTNTLQVLSVASCNISD